MELQERFWDATIEELKQGFFEEDHRLVCLLCGREIEKGVIYPDDGLLYEPKRYISLHVEREHGSVFAYLTGLDKKLTGLTDHQSRLLRLFYQGKSDAEVQEETGIKSASTIRNHRFALKEKERQAKVFLTIMELLKERDAHAPAFVPLHKSAKMVDDRYNVTEEERETILSKLFPAGTDGKLLTFKLKEKQRYVVLREIATRFEPGITYTESEVNEILKGAYDDYVTLRRFLIEYGFLDREPDGSKYWLVS